MPTWRPPVPYDTGGAGHLVKANPTGWRGHLFLRQIPFWTGSEVQARITITLVNMANATPVDIKVLSDIDHRKLRTIHEEVCEQFPYSFTTRKEFITAESDYRYEVRIFGITHNVAEFRARSRDVSVERIILVIIGVLASAIGTGIIQLIRLIG